MPLLSRKKASNELVRAKLRYTALATANGPDIGSELEKVLCAGSNTEPANEFFKLQ